MTSPYRPRTSLANVAISLALAAQALWPITGLASDLRGQTVQPLRYGVNRFALMAGSQAGMAVLGHRENFNAHDFDVLTLYAELPAGQGQPAQWQIVPLFDAQGEHLEVKRSGGADCVLHDFRLLRPTAAGDATLILADRELGNAFASPATVAFRFFRLKRNDEGMPGRPVYYFEFDHARQAAQPYCDVGEALQSELGIGTYRANPP